MKRMLAVLLLALGLLFGGLSPAYAAGADKIHIIDQLLDNAPTSITGALDISSYKKVAFFVDYDETDSGGLVSIAITAHISHDNTNFISYSWYDIAGTTTLQTNETMTADGNYVGWLEVDKHIPILRITITATGSTATELADVDCFIAGIR